MIGLESVECYLWKKGFVKAPLRIAMRNLFCFSCLFFLLGILLLPFGPQVLQASVMSLLSCWNFYTIALFVQHTLPASIPEGDSGGVNTARKMKKALLLRSQLRLFITGIFVYIALVAFQANPVALAAGLSSAVIIIPASLILRR